MVNKKIVCSRAREGEGHDNNCSRRPNCKVGHTGWIFAFIMCWLMAVNLGIGFLRTAS